MPETPLKGRGSLSVLPSGWRSWRNGAVPSRLPPAADRTQPPPSRPDDTDAEVLLSPAPVTERALEGTPRLDARAFLLRELSWGHDLSSRRLPSPSEHVVNFLRVPLALEPFLTFGHLLCTDLFLFHFTLLPIRCIAALWAAARAFFAAARGLFGGVKHPAEQTPIFTQAHCYDLIKGALIVCASTVVGYVQVSRVYHYIRGEQIIKLYVIYNMLEVFDKLACSLGQDVMDSLYRTTRDHLQLGARGDGGVRARVEALLRLSFHFSVAVFYVVSHSLILFVQVVCLNVAVNSRHNALLTLIVSNNFLELKSSVFKRFEAENLFQVACADVVERFQLGLFLLLISIQELTSFSLLSSVLPAVLTIFASEIIVDYLKHSFIGKFNRLHSDLYATFTAILSSDVIAVRARMASSLDPTHSCVKRLGLATLPLVVVTHRMLLLRFGPPDGSSSAASVAAAAAAAPDTMTLSAAALMAAAAVGGEGGATGGFSGGGAEASP